MLFKTRLFTVMLIAATPFLAHSAPSSDAGRSLETSVLASPSNAPFSRGSRLTLDLLPEDLALSTSAPAAGTEPGETENDDAASNGSAPERGPDNGTHAPGSNEVELELIKAGAVGDEGAGAGGAPWVPDGKIREEESGTVHKAVIRYSTLVGVPLGTLAYGRQFWNWGDSSQWRWARERWFGADTDLGGMDKLGHAHACYIITRLANRIFTYSEDGRRRSLLYAAIVAGVIGTGIEIGDAYTGAFGFSYEDLVADYVGIALAVVLESYPTLDAFVGFSALYWPTREYLARDFSLVDRVLKIESDAGGWKHFLNFKLAGFESLGYEVPASLAMLQFDFGYYTRGFSNHDRLYHGEDRDKVRSLYFGISLNYQQMSRDVIEPISGRLHAALNEMFHYVHVPIGASRAVDLD